MSTDNSTLHSMSPTTDPGSHQRSPHHWLRVTLITALVLLLVLPTAGVLTWKFLISPQLSCSSSKATDPTRSGAVTEYCLPSNVGYAMTVGPDGNLWFMDSGKIERITPQGVITEFAVPTPPTAVPLPGIARGPDGNLWFIAGTKLGRISPQGHFVGVVSMPPRVWYITGLTAAPDGTLWVGLATGANEKDQLTHEIARVTATGQVIAVALPKPVAPAGGLVAGADGNLWVAAMDKPIGRITRNGQLTEFAVATDEGLSQLTPGPDGNIWFIGAGGKVGRITPTGAVTLFQTAEQANEQASGGGSSIGTGPDGNVWFSAEPGTIARITPSGAVTRFTLPHKDNVTAITAGPDGGVWFLLVSGWTPPPPFVINSTRIVRIMP